MKAKNLVIRTIVSFTMGATTIIGVQTMIPSLNPHYVDILAGIIVCGLVFAHLENLEEGK